MKKIISTITFLTLFGTVFFAGQRCLAQDQSIGFNTIGGNEVAGYINSTNTGFSVLGHIPDIAGFDHASVKINNENLIGEINSPNSNFSFEVGPISLDDLKVWFPEGNNVVRLYLYDALGQVGEPLEIPVIADYTLDPTDLEVSYQRSINTNIGYLRVGDSANMAISSDEQLDIDSIVSTVNGREISWTEEILPSEYRYLGQHEVIEGDSDLPLPYQVEVGYRDLAGNEDGATEDLNNAIDSNSPSIEVESITDGQIFANNDVLFRFSQSEPLSGYTVLLNGEIVGVVNGGVLGDLADGEYTLGVTASDLAGNMTTLGISFSVDTIAPATGILSPIDSSYTQGDELVIEGITDPDSKVVIEVHSDTRYYETLADNEGNWRISIDSSELSEGMHEIYLEVTDPASNKSRVLLGVFEIIVPQITKQDESEPIILAQAQTTEIVSDVQPAVIKRKVSDEEKVAIEPKIISSSDERQLGINWSAWLILIGLIAVSFLVAGVSYYGYAQAVAVVNKRKTYLPPPVTPEQEKTSHETPDEKEEVASDKTISQENQSDDEEDIQVRW